MLICLTASRLKLLTYGAQKAAIYPQLGTLLWPEGGTQPRPGPDPGQTRPRPAQRPRGAWHLWLGSSGLPAHCGPRCQCIVDSWSKQGKQLLRVPSGSDSRRPSPSPKEARPLLSGALSVCSPSLCGVPRVPRMRSGVFSLLGTQTGLQEDSAGCYPSPGPPPSTEESSCQPAAALLPGVGPRARPPKSQRF